MCSCRRWRGVLKDVERGGGWLGHRRGSSSGQSAPGSCIQQCMPTDLERDRGGETCHYCRNKSTPFIILRVTSHSMIHCTDGRSGEAMLYSTTKPHAWLGNVCCFVRGTPHNSNFKGTFFLGRKSNPTALPADANLCWALCTERNQHLTACYKMGSLCHAVSGIPSQLPHLITVPHGWAPSSISSSTHLFV